MPEGEEQGAIFGRFESDHRAFLQLLPGLIQNPRYQGRYVAIAKGEIVDDDADELVLAERVAQSLPNVHVFVGCVSDAVNEVVFSSPEFDDL
jgi:hypothetical protein